MDLGELVAESLDRHRVLGAAVGIVDSDGAAQIVAAGTRGAGRGRIEDDSVFAAASLTKPLFASGVMALISAEVIDLDCPLTRYLARPYLDDERATLITARTVLSHTTGLPNWRQDGPLFMRWSPGARWGYSGEGYAYLQEVVGHLTGMPLDRYLAEAVLRPLGMNDSTLMWPDEHDHHVAVGHGSDGKPHPPFQPPRAKAAAGGLFTTAPDYLRFLAHSFAHADAMFEPQARIDAELAWGLGWGVEEVDGGRAIWQWGDDPGYKNFVLGFPDARQGAVVFTNGDGGAAVYADVVRQLYPGRHPSLEVWQRPSWIDSWTTSPVSR